MSLPVRGLIRPHRTKLTFFYRATDIVLIVGGLWLVCAAHSVPWHERYGFAAATVAVFFVLLAERYDLYRSWRITPIRQEISQLWLAWIGSMLGLLAIIFLFQTSERYPRGVVLAWFVAVPMVLALWRAVCRAVLREIRRYGHNSRSVAVLGANALGMRLADTMERAPWMGLRMVGFYDDRDDSGGRIKSLPIAGTIDELVAKARQAEIDILYIALPLKAEERVNEVIGRLADTTVSVYLVPDFFVFDLLHARWQSIGELPVVSVYESPFYGVDGWLKRFEDLVMSSAILVFSAIPMLFIAIGIKLSSRGPVLYKQHRYGFNGQEIEVWKFRTMTVCEHGELVKQAQRHDPRLTRFGRFLRRTSLDELPQFFNVLQGTMSVIGPRPHAIVHNEQYRQVIKGYMLRHKVKPGITGWAQVNGWRGETDTLEKMRKRIEFDLEYISNWSLMLDVKIFWLTLYRGFIHENAY